MEGLHAIVYKTTIIFLSLKMNFLLANIADIDELSHLGLRCLYMLHFLHAFSLLNGVSLAGQ